MDTKGLCRRFGISGNDSNVWRIEGPLERLKDGRKHGFITGIIEAVITGNDDFIICHIFLQKIWSTAPES